MINPLLAQNMGRWAEVYFTHPPDEREQAVQELVRQLEEENKGREAQVSNSAGLATESNQTVLRSVVEPTALCGGCGHENPVSQRFCGMCGVALAQPGNHGSEPTASPSLVEAAPQTSRDGGWAQPEKVESIEPENTQHYFLEERRKEYETEIEPPMFATEPSFSYSYRVFLGLALAIVLGVLGYMAWHKGQNVSQEGAQAPPPVADQTPAPDQGTNKKAEQGTNQAAASPAREATPTKAEVANQEAPKSGDSAKEQAPSSAAVATQPARESAPTADTKAAPTEKAPVSRAAKTEKIPATGGADELAMAQRYLNGENGQRDPSQAAQWLWRSVAKQNSQATLMLADLYLHGDGIQKNCDQARILLDAAASKGQPGAATRLRNLSAFGCQ